METRSRVLRELTDCRRRTKQNHVDTKICPDKEIKKWYWRGVFTKTDILKKQTHIVTKEIENLLD